MRELLFALAFVAPAPAPAHAVAVLHLGPAPAHAVALPPGQLVWSDDFSHGIVPEHWTMEVTGNGGNNDELQYYTARPENVRIEDGHLVIEARKESYESMAYTSAQLISGASWTYGRVEVRAKLPAARGTWPAIWMMPRHPSHSFGAWPDNGEIDIMEHVGFDYGVVHASLHTKAFNWMEGNQKTAMISVPNVDGEFHVYALDWGPELITIEVDGKPYFSYANPHTDWEEWPFDSDFYLILNLAVGGIWGGQKGIDDAAFPQRMTVDWVKVYQSQPLSRP